MNQEIPNTGGDTITDAVAESWQKTACSNIPPHFTGGLIATTQLNPNTEMGDFN